MNEKQCKKCGRIIYGSGKFCQDCKSKCAKTAFSLSVIISAMLTGIGVFIKKNKDKNKK